VLRHIKKASRPKALTNRDHQSTHCWTVGVLFMWKICEKLEELILAFG
jgi:hypothetical protein